MSARSLHSLRTQLGAIFLAFSLLVGGSVATTFLTLRSQAHDAAVINLAGRQRMLTQKMTWLALARPDDPELAASIQLFDQTLRALRDGGPAVDPAGRRVTLPPAPDQELKTQLDAVVQTWSSFQSHLQAADLVAVQAESPAILEQLNSVVSGFETRAQAKTRYLRAVQLVFVITALLLLALGYLFTRRRILEPLGLLGGAAARMTAGHLGRPVPVSGKDEFGDLGRAFESMRVELAAGREQLEARVAQRTRELSSAFELSQEIVAKLDLANLLHSVADHACSLTGAGAAYLCLFDPDGSHLALAASSPERATRSGGRQPAHLGIAAQVVGQGQTVSIQAACSECAIARLEGPHHRLAAPVRAGETTLGALCVTGCSETPFDPEVGRALTLLANSAAVAIANARLAETGRRQAEHAAAQAERDRLAGELHDHLAQTLGFLNLKADRVTEMLAGGRAAEAPGELERMRSAIATAYRQVRAALAGLREPLLAGDAEQSPGRSFFEGLSACLAEFREAAGVPASLLVADEAALSLPPVLQAQAVQIVREALTNIRRHARASRVEVRVERAGGETLFTVQDDGCGFDPEAIEGSSHLGLAIMRMRVERTGGRLLVQSTPGAGARIVAAFPLSAAGAERPREGLQI